MFVPENQKPKRTEEKQAKFLNGSAFYVDLPAVGEK